MSGQPHGSVLWHVTCRHLTPSHMNPEPIPLLADDDEEYKWLDNYILLDCLTNQKFDCVTALTESVFDFLID